MALKPQTALDPAPLSSSAARLRRVPAWPLAGLAALTLAALSGCGQGAGGPQGGQMPPAPVGVITAKTSSVDVTTELPGRLEAIRTAQVRARVTGVVKRRLFTEGSVVKAGQSLFEIDPVPYRAALDSALATEAKAEAVLMQAQATLDRNRPLAQAKAISDQDWVSTQAAFKQAQADVAAAKAAVVQAKLNVDYAAVLSPISGRIGRAAVTEGALVSAGEATLLATVQQIDKLYVNFTESAADVLKLKRAVEAGKFQKAGSAEVHVVLDDGTVYPLAGQLLFSDITVDSTSGQVTLRAELPNPKGELLPGLYVKVRIATARATDAILVPQQAVSRGTAGDTVMIVTPDKQVSVRPVQLGGTHGSDWVVLGGLQPGDQVIVDGFQKIRPKAAVNPVPWTPAGPASAPAAAAPASAASH
ncbi:efflux RND transporter periplasmic adaptor subunit [Ideonella dechloratans]|uniref:efflux RND transporter periplasmic adaptor subunit n=1 Tax=Ideonella dechloratans TaxID=36863 RepID=UPI0035B44BA9